MRYFLIFMALHVSTVLFGQSDSLSMSLQLVEILSNRIDEAGQTRTSWKATGNALVSTGNLADQLSNSSVLFVRSYGLGSLATPSVRGTGASHLAVLWQGFNIQSVMNGTLDLSLLPANGFNQIQFQYGGGAALFGSGAIGGVLHLGNRLAYNEGLQVGLATQLAAFRQMSYEPFIQFSSERWSTQWRFFYRSAENDFNFNNIAEAGAPEQSNDNAALWQTGLTQETSLRIGDSQFLKLATWIQYSDREIPASMTEASSESYQLDGNIRQAISWNGEKGAYQYGIRTAFQREDIRFVDPTIGLNAFNRAHSYFLALDQSFQFSDQWNLEGGWQSDWHFATADNYPDAAQLTRHAAFAKLGFVQSDKPGSRPWSRWQSHVSVRQAFDETALFPASFEWGYRIQFDPSLAFFGNASRNFRTPTFNDLFWVGAGATGNPNLLAEQGWSGEQGIDWKTKLGSVHWSGQFSGFSILTKNWIIWLPNSENGQQVWRPENELSVWSRGIDVQQEWSIRSKLQEFNLQSTYHLCQATNRLGEHKGKVLIYTPIHQGGIQANWKHQSGLGLTYNQQFVGKRFTTRNNSEDLPAYSFAHLDVQYQRKLKRYTWNTQVRLNNIWDQAFQVIAWRPQAGRWIEWRMAFTFHTKSSK